MSYIYVASNPGLLPGLVKIGTSRSNPSDRLRSLSRSTSIPTNFVLEYEKETKFAARIESRVHSILNELRFRKNKEFFSIPLDRAVDIIEKVSEFTECPGVIGTEIGKHKDLIESHYVPKLTLFELNLMNLLMAATNFMMIRHVIRFERDLVDGFLDSDVVSSELFISRAWTAKAMSTFLTKGKVLHINFIGRQGTMRVFDEIHYHRGELRWLFQESFLGLFTNNKI